MDNETITNNTGQEDEISLLDLFAVIWHWKVMIIIITLLAAIGVATYSIISIKMPPEKSYLPNVYTPKALMLIDDKSAAGGLSSMLGNMGGLASMAGVRMPVNATNSRLAVFLVGTNSLLDSVVDKFNLIEKYKIKKNPRGTSRKIIKSMLKAVTDEKSGVLTISFTDKDPVFAHNVVNYCVSYLEKRFDELGLDKNKIEKENLELNLTATLLDIQELEEESRRLEQSVTSFSGRLPNITRDINRITLELTAKRQVYTQLRVQYELLKVNMASENPIFQILELAEVPDMKSGPGRGMLCIIVTFAAAFFSVFLAFVLNAIANIKKDPSAIAKLRGKHEK
jgi:Chain length determinant protein